MDNVHLEAVNTKGISKVSQISHQNVARYVHLWISWMQIL